MTINFLPKNVDGSQAVDKCKQGKRQKKAGKTIDDSFTSIRKKVFWRQEHACTAETGDRTTGETSGRGPSRDKIPNFLRAVRRDPDTPPSSQAPRRGGTPTKSHYVTSQIRLPACTVGWKPNLLQHTHTLFLMHTPHTLTRTYSLSQSSDRTQLRAERKICLLPFHLSLL